MAPAREKVLKRKRSSGPKIEGADPLEGDVPSLQSLQLEPPPETPEEKMPVAAGPAIGEAWPRRRWRLPLTKAKLPRGRPRTKIEMPAQDPSAEVEAKDKRPRGRPPGSRKNPRAPKRSKVDAAPAEDAAKDVGERSQE